MFSVFCRFGGRLPLLVSLCVLVGVAVSQSAAQAPSLDYAPDDQRFGTVEPCETLGGSVQTVDGASFCSDIDKGGTFCIVGSQDAFPCAGLYRSVVRCNSKYDRPALNPFVCAAKCDIHNGEFARGKSCICESIFVAATEDDAVCAKFWINSGVSPNEFDRDDDTPLHYAARENSPAVAAILLQNGANVDQQGQYSDRPIHLAVENDAREIIPVLVSATVNLDAPDGGDRAPLHLAVREENAYMVSALITLGANVNIQDDDEETPLHYAIYPDLFHISSLLISGGANVNARDYRNETPLHRAAYNGGLGLISLLISNGANVNAKDDSEETPLIEATRNGRFFAMSLLISNGADVNAEDAGGDAALHHVRYSSELSAAAVSLLIAGGADVNNVGRGGRTPLHDAAFHDEAVGAASLLIMNGARLEEKDDDGYTPIFHAVYTPIPFGDTRAVQMVSLLAASGANVNALQGSGSSNLSPLYRASFGGVGSNSGGSDETHFTIVSILIAAGANVTLRYTPSSGEYYTLLGRFRNAPKINALLIESGADVNQRAYFRRDSDINIYYHYPLHYIMRSIFNPYPVVSLMISKGATVDVRDDDGNTPLHFASGEGLFGAEREHPDVVRLLLASGANVNAVAAESYGTPLHYAVRSNFRRNAEALLEGGANVNAQINHVGQSMHGKTPMDLAIDRGYFAMQSLLMRNGGVCNVSCQ